MGDTQHMINEDYWPPPEAYLNLSGVSQLSDGRARCTVVAMCDETGQPTRIFYQGQEAHFFYEFEILSSIGMPGGGLEIYDATGQVIHGKNTFQSGAEVPRSVKPGARLRFHQNVRLEIGLGEYLFTVGLASTDENSYAEYRDGPLTHLEFDRLVVEHCRVRGVGSLVVQLNARGKLLHHGTANLPGECKVTYAPPSATEMRPTAIFHVTHQRAGSQWIYRILRDCAPERIISPQLGETQFLNWVLQEGKVYPTVYVTKQQFDSVRLPPNWRRFVVIRDLRDTLVSAYFGIKVSHPVQEYQMARWRAHLLSQSIDEGFIYLMDEWLFRCSRIQASWLEAGEQLIRYEDLLKRDLEILERVLLDECELPVSRERLREAVLANRFERLTGGRPRGREDIAAHERKGIVGDWRNYFSERVKRAFKSRYGGLLVATGYEQNLDW